MATSEKPNFEPFFEEDLIRVMRRFSAEKEIFNFQLTLKFF